MKKYLVALVAALTLSSMACTSIESAKVNSADIAANGEAVAVVQATALGLTALFHLITISEASLDLVVNKMLVTEAKALGGNRVQLLSAHETPKGGFIFKLAGGIIGLPSASATGIVVR